MFYFLIVTCVNFISYTFPHTICTYYNFLALSLENDLTNEPISPWPIHPGKRLLTPHVLCVRNCVMPAIKSQRHTSDLKTATKTTTRRRSQRDYYLRGCWVYVKRLCVVFIFIALSWKQENKTKKKFQYLCVVYWNKCIRNVHVEL